jgi:hypothetical protein
MVGALSMAQAAPQTSAEDGLVVLTPPAASPSAADRARNVRAVAAAPDASLLATAAGGERVDVWRPNGELVRSIPLAGSVCVLAISPDAETLTVGTYSKLVLVDLRSGAQRSVDAEVVAAAYARDGRLATISAGGRVALRDPASGQEQRVIREGTPQTMDSGSIAFSADGRWLAFAMGRGVDVVDTSTGAEVWSRGKRSWGPVSFAPDAPQLAFIDDALWAVVELPRGKILRGAPLGPTAGLALAGGRQLVGVDDGQLMLFDLDLDHKRALYPGRAVSRLCLASAGGVLVGCEDGSAALVPLGRAVRASPTDPYRASPAAALQIANARRPVSDAEVLAAARGLFAVRRDGQKLELSLSWKGHGGIRRVILGALFVCFGLFFAPVALDSLFALLLDALFWVGGLGTWYYALACRYNTTRVEADGSNLSIRLGPVPWWGSRRFPIDRIRQFYVKELAVTGSRYGTPTRYLYELHAKLVGRRDAKVLSAAIDRNEAQALEATLEAHLGIADVDVAGESISSRVARERARPAASDQR